jgi:hypothetical protein
MLDRPPHLITSHDFSLRESDGRDLRRQVAHGDAVRIKRGAYVPVTTWQSLRPHQRQQHLVAAFAESHPNTIFSHHSAAAIHGLPIIGGWPTEVHAAAGRAAGGRSEPGLRRHCRGLEASETTLLDGIPVTTVERTLVDLALILPFRCAVAPIDHALRVGLVSRDDLLTYWMESSPFRGHRKAFRAVEFGNGLAANPGESLSRAVIHELGFPAPRLQVEHPRADGLSDFTDFEWPDFAMIGEFDGRGKYFEAQFMNGRSSDQVIYDEKLREDRLRAGSPHFARWGWDDAWAVYPLRDKLLRAGLRPCR